MRRIRILIVDDAVVIRQLLSRVLAEDPAIEVVGTAANGKVALSKVAQLSPDVVTMDVEMPEMDGIETLTRLRKTHPKLPVIMFSTLTERGAATTLEALARGAADYVTKPANVGSATESIQRVREELLPRVKALCGLAPSPVARPRPSPRPVSAATPASQGIDVLAIGCSTGGPNALVDLLATFPGGFPVPIVIVQHMPPIFTRLLADRLSKTSRLRVREAQDGEPLQAGDALLAPGNFHMTLVKDGLRVRARLNQGPPENSCRPAVDVLFRSVASVYGARTLSVVLTGMGQDGLRGCQDLRAAGGRVLVQDEASSVVWGMPGVVANAGLADRVLPLGQLGAEITRRVIDGRAQVRPPSQSSSSNGPVS